jgi:hypothetical protein
MSLRILARTTVITFLFLLSTGCVSSPWEHGYKPTAALSKIRFTPTTQPAIRTVEFERVREFVADDAKRRAASDVAVEDETPQMKLERRGRLLKAFRVPEKPEDVVVIGTAEFGLYVNLDPKTGDLDAFAKKIGADYAAVAIGYLGPVNTVEYMPSTTYGSSFGTATAYGSGGSVTAYSQTNTTATTYEPVQVTRPYYQYDVIYVRRLRSSDPPIPVH